MAPSADGLYANPTVATIERPTLLIWRERVERNIRQMAHKAQQSGTRLRPHFKTHQSAVVGEWFQAAGITDITVSSVDMAAYFAAHGWSDITIAFPANIRQIRQINELVQGVRLGLLIESHETARFLDDHLAGTANAWIKIDAGYGRTGLRWDDATAIVALAHEISACKRLGLRGILCHSGHTYGVRGQVAVQALYDQTVERMLTVRDQLQQAGFAGLDISVGDTPACSLVERFDGVDEIRPGNFVYYDLTQVQIGSCAEEQIGVALACPVVAKHPLRNTVIVYGGAVHLSKDVLHPPEGQPSFGRVAPVTAEGWGPALADVSVASLSQEHGIIKGPPAWVESVHVGDLVLVLPVHSCLTVDLMQEHVRVLE